MKKTKPFSTEKSLDDFISNIMPWLYIFFFHYLTADEDYFLLENYNDKLCLYQKPKGKKTFVFKDATCSYDDGNSRWIWTNYGQLLNWKTLECMTDDRFVTMKKCDRHNQKQLWECVNRNYGKFSKYVRTRKTHLSTAQKWVRHGSGNNVCSQGNL